MGEVTHGFNSNRKLRVMKLSPDPKPATSQMILSALRAGPLREPAHIWLYEVRNGTGYSRQPRYADALVVSVYPSRGIWLAGIEVKVNRGDWRRELDDPKKADELQRFCDYWWIAAPAGVVETAEVPKTWGQYVIEGKKVRVGKRAPKLKPAPYTRPFLASVLRNDAECLNRIREQGYSEGHEAATSALDQEQIQQLRDQLLESERERQRLEHEARFAKQDLAGLKQTIAEFDRAAGIGLTSLASYRGGNYGPRNIGEQFKAAQLLAQSSPAELAERFLEVGNALLQLAELTAAPEKETGT